MLGDSPVAAMIPSKDVDRARDFYENKLGLKVVKEFHKAGGGVEFESGGVTVLVYQTFEDIGAKHTLATWKVSDIEAVMADLRSKGVAFEDYDFPEMKTENGIMSDPVMGKASWFKDPEGNVLGLVQEV